VPLSCSHSQPPGNGQIEARFVLRRAASELVDERAVDLLDVDATVLHRLDLVGDLQKLLRGGFRIGIRAWLNEFPMCDCSVELPRAEFVNQTYIQHRSVSPHFSNFTCPDFPSVVWIVSVIVAPGATGAFASPLKEFSPCGVSENRELKLPAQEEATLVFPTTFYRPLPSMNSAMMSPARDF
jgi:hypothetical protein